MNTTQNTPEQRTTDDEDRELTGEEIEERDAGYLDAFDDIVALLNGGEWDASTIERVAEIIRGAGAEISDHELPYVQTCERTECARPLTFVDVETGDGLCEKCAQRDEPHDPPENRATEKPEAVSEDFPVWLLDNRRGQVVKILDHVMGDGLDAWVVAVDGTPASFPVLTIAWAEDCTIIEHCERADCGNELDFDSIQAGDGLCGSCAEPVGI